jgi:hypothetical protein
LEPAFLDCQWATPARLCHRWETTMTTITTTLSLVRQRLLTPPAKDVGRLSSSSGARMRRVPTSMSIWRPSAPQRLPDSVCLVLHLVILLVHQSVHFLTLMATECPMLLWAARTLKELIVSAQEAESSSCMVAAPTLPTAMSLATPLTPTHSPYSASRPETDSGRLWRMRGM